MLGAGLGLGGDIISDVEAKAGLKSHCHDIWGPDFFGDGDGE